MAKETFWKGGKEKMTEKIKLNKAEIAEIKRNQEKGKPEFKYLVIYPGGAARVLCWEKPDEKDLSPVGAICYAIKEYSRSKTGIPVGVIVNGPKNIKNSIEGGRREPLSDEDGIRKARAIGTNRSWDEMAEIIAGAEL